MAIEVHDLAAVDHPNESEMIYSAVGPLAIAAEQIELGSAKSRRPSLAFIVISGSFITILGMLIFTVIVYSKV
jgi:hypothetical protein